MARPKGHKLNARAWDDMVRMSGTSLTQVANSSDIPRPTLSGVVSGNQRASVPMAHRIAAAIGCHVETLFPTLNASNDRSAAA